MTFSAKPRYLPEDLKDFAAPRPRTDLVWAAAAAILALVAYVQPVEPAIAEEIEVRQAIPQGPVLQIACMNERLHITWIDPHTGDHWATVCDTHRISRPM